MIHYFRKFVIALGAVVEVQVTCPFVCKVLLMKCCWKAAMESAMRAFCLLHEPTRMVESTLARCRMPLLFWDVQARALSPPQEFLLLDLN